MPTNPNSELRSKIQNFLNNRSNELGMYLRVVETSGKIVKYSLVNLDLTVFMFLWVREQRGAGPVSLDWRVPHTQGQVSSTTCHNTCKVCAETNVLAKYHVESRDNAVHCLGQHEVAIERKDTKNAMAKHLDTILTTLGTLTLSTSQAWQLLRRG